MLLVDLNTRHNRITANRALDRTTDTCILLKLAGRNCLLTVSPYNFLRTIVRVACIAGSCRCKYITIAVRCRCHGNHIHFITVILKCISGTNLTVIMTIRCLTNRIIYTASIITVITECIVIRITGRCNLTARILHSIIQEDIFISKPSKTIMRVAPVSNRGRYFISNFCLLQIIGNDLIGRSINICPGFLVRRCTPCTVIIPDVLEVTVVITRHRLVTALTCLLVVSGEYSALPEHILARLACCGGNITEQLAILTMYIRCFQVSIYSGCFIMRSNIIRCEWFIGNPVFNLQR